jgi:hypothetical protein
MVGLVTHGMRSVRELKARMVGHGRFPGASEVGERRPLAP